MLNRAQRRKTDKLLKGKLTQDQFELIKGQIIDERVREEVDRFVGNFVSVYLPAMRENKISEERANRIIEDVFNRAQERFNKGEKGEPRPNDKYVEADAFESVTAKVLKANGIDNPEELAHQIYNEFMKGEKGEAEE